MPSTTVLLRCQPASSAAGLSGQPGRPNTFGSWLSTIRIAAPLIKPLITG